MVLLEDGLRNFPRREGDTFDRLQNIVEKKLETVELKTCEKTRLEKELSVIKQTDTASVFLFFYDTVYALKEIGAILFGVCQCSYLLYFLGLTKVNPFDYRLPFERYFGTNRKYLPIASVAVKKGLKGRVIRHLKERYGADKIARVKDMENEYILSSKSLLALGEIEQTILHTSPVEELVWHEDLSLLTLNSASKLNLYMFTLVETDIGECRLFSDGEIYQKTLSVFSNEFRAGWTAKKYIGLEKAEAIFSLTDGKFVYQEQFFEICAELLGVDNQKADEFRRDLCKSKKQAAEDVRALFSWKLGKEGVALFDYLNDNLPYAVCKAYVISLLFLDLEKKS